MKYIAIPDTRVAGRRQHRIEAIHRSHFTNVAGLADKLTDVDAGRTPGRHQPG